MKYGIVVFPGSNCDDDMVHAAGKVLGHTTYKLWHKDEDLRDLDPQQDCIVLPGGFSYGDYLRAGAIARFSPIMQSVAAFAKRGGRVLGICNGFQILCEAGLLPGVLLRNKNQQFICRNLFIRTESRASFLTSHLPKGKVLNIPIAHAEGRYYADETTLRQLRDNDQILFRYCSADGEVSEAANPNGAIDHIAGICNEQGNVVGMMPHPERAVEELLGSTDGKTLLQWV